MISYAVNDPGSGGGGSASGSGTGSGGAGSGSGSAGSAGGSGSGSGSGSGIAPGMSTSQFVDRRSTGRSGGFYQIFRLTPDRPENGPDVRVGERDTVYVSPIPTNTQNAFVSTQGSTAAKSGPNFVLTNAANPRQIKVRNLNEIWMYSTVVGEGVTVDHQPAL